MKHLPLIIILLLLASCKKEQQQCPTAPPKQPAVTATWQIVPTGTPGQEFTYMVYFGDGFQMFVAGVAGDTMLFDANIDDLNSVEYRDTTGTVSYLNFHPLASDTASVRVDLLPCTRL